MRSKAERLLSLRAGMDAIDIPIFVLSDEAGSGARLELVNAAFVQVAKEVSPSDLLGRSPTELLAPPYGARIASACREALATGARQQCEIGAEDRYWRVVISPCEVATGEVPYAICTAVDVTELVTATRALEERNTLLRTQQKTLPDAVVQIDQEGRIVSWNRHYLEMFGLSEAMVRSGELEPVRAQIRNLTAEPEHFDARFRHYLQHPEQDEQRTVVTLRDGRILERYSAAVPNARGGWLGRIWFYRDITARYRSEERFRQLVETSIQGILVCCPGHDWELRFVNRSAAEIFGFENEAELLATTAFITRINAAIRQRMEPQWPALASGRNRQFHTMLHSYRRDGQELWIDAVACAMTWDNEAALQIALIDATERRHLEDDLRVLASTDALTGLLNRRQFTTSAGQRLTEAQQGNLPTALLMIDADHFKTINDRYGHATGDRVLRGLSAVLRRLLRREDVIGRIGGEEFCALLPGVTMDAALRIAERIRATCERIHVNDTAPTFTVSIGVAERRVEESALEPLMIRADRALYAAKHAGRNRVMEAD